LLCLGRDLLCLGRDLLCLGRDLLCLGRDLLCLVEGPARGDRSTSPNNVLRWCLALAVLVCPYGADPLLRAPAVAIARGGIGGYFKAGELVGLRSRFHLAACGWAMTAPNGNPYARYATVIQTSRRATGCSVMRNTHLSCERIAAPMVLHMSQLVPIGQRKRSRNERCLSRNEYESFWTNYS
jgi:hypothetical protein